MFSNAEIENLQEQIRILNAQRTNQHQHLFQIRATGVLTTRDNSHVTIMNLGEPVGQAPVGPTRCVGCNAVNEYAEPISATGAPYKCYGCRRGA